MSRFTIYSITGTAKTEIEVLELHDEWMAECFVTVTVKSEEPIDFVIGDYIIYRDEKYAIDYDPTVIKKARRGSYGEGFVYDNIKFAHDAQSKIVRCDFTDIVLSPDSETNKIHYSSLPTFPFYCASVDDLLDRVQACLEELYLGQFVIIGLNSIRNKERGQAVGRRQEFIDAYKKYIDPAYIPSGQEATDPYGKQDVAETVDNISCWDALVKIHDDFDLNFIQRGYVVVAGTNGALTASTFRYGKGNGLYELERISDSSKQIVTRLRGYGNETNLPSRYYATLNMQVFANALVAANGMVTVNLKYRTDYFLEVSPAGESILTTKIGDTEYPNSAVRINGLDGNVIVDTRTSVPIAAGTKIYFLDGVKKDAFPTENRDYSTNNLPDNMAVSRLMLPGFPNQSLADWVEAHKDDEDKDWLRAAITAGFEFSTNQYRPYIDSPNKEEYEIRPASIYFDGSDETDDIYPTIEEMEYQGHRIDQVVEAEQITDNGVFTKEGDIPNFKITLPDLGFNLLEYYEDGASIDMKSGMCGARSFEFAKKPTRDAQTGHWICTVKRVHDDALDLWFPYNDFQIRPNDKYVLIGIDMPNAYVNAASVKLLKASLEALDENDEPQYTYQPRIDEIWMQRQHNNSIGSAITSIHDTIKAGDIFQFEDADLGVSDEIIIDVLTIKENGNNGIPTYEVTLRNEKQVSTIQKAVEKAVSGSSAVSGSAGGYSGRQVYNAIENYGSDFFLSKNTDDVANGEIGFLKGLWIKVKGLFGISEDGNALLHDADMSGKVHVGEDLNVEGEILGTSAVLDEIRSSEYTGDGMLDTGYKLWYEEGRAKLVIDDLVARGKFTVNELEARKWTYAGGNMVFSGAGSTLFFVEYLDANENTLGYTNINSPWLLAGRPLLSAMVAWSKRRTVKRQLTDAEKAQVVKFRCYEYSDDGTMQTRNWWHVNDIAMCETLNKVKDKANSDGSYSGYASNTVYKRRVAGIGSKEIAVLNDGRVYDYVDLWNIYNVQGQTYINSQGQEATITDNVKGFLNMAPSGQTPSTDWPAAGDVIVQCGNPLDADRQAVVTIEVQGTLHGFKVYDTINDYSMANKEWVEIGYDQTTGKAKSNIYGDFRFGCRENEEQNGGSYVKYNRTTKQLDIKANVRFMSPTSPQQETTLNDFARTVTGDIDYLQSQIDGEIDTWFYDYMPVSDVDSKEPLIDIVIEGQTVHCQPYYDWYTADGGGTAQETDIERIKHLGDIFYDTSSGYAFRFTRNETTNAFEWTIIEDSAVIKALEEAAKAQDTADHKRRVFVEQPAPIAPKTYVEYDVGDLWVNATYPSGYTGPTDLTDPANPKYRNDVLRCKTAKPTRSEETIVDGTFSIADWELASKYTDDTKANEVAVGLAQEITDRGQAVAAAQAAAAQDATNKVNAAKEELEDAIDAVDDAHSTAEGALEDGYIDNDEREALKAVLKSLDAEFADVTASYSVVYNNSLLNDTTEKTALYNAYTALTNANNALDSAFISFINAPATTKYEKGDSEGSYTYTPAGQQEPITVNLTTLQTTFNTCASTYQTALESANAKIQDKIKEIADAATTEITSFRYIKNALGATTVTQGGLMLTSAIFLRQLKQCGDPTKDTDYITWSGINGTTPDGDRSIAAWYGGDMEDLEAAATVDPTVRYAKTLFRMDGTGYMAGGKIHWDSNGDGFVANGNVAWTTINGVTSVTINGATVQNSPSVNTQQLLLNGTDVTAKLNALFDMFEKDTTTVPGTTLIKANYSLYSVGDVSALGNSSGGGGGGGGGASVLYELNDVLSNAAGTSVLDAQEGYVLTCVTNGGVLKWKAAPTAPTYVLPQATSGALGGIKIGYTDATVGTRNYAVALDNDGKAYVQVPWENTTYSAGTGISLSGTTFSNSGVRAVSISGNSLRVNTDGTNDDLTIPYATSAGSVAWGNVSSKPSYIFCYQGEVSTAYVNGTTYSKLDSGTYYVQYSGYSDSLIHFQHGGSASGLDIKFEYTQSANNPLMYRKTIDSNRFASTDWVTLIDSLNISSQSVNYATSAGSATKATQDGDGNTISSTYLNLIGGTLTGNLTVNPENANDSRIGVTNTNASGTYIYLLASTNRGVYHSTAGWLVATNGTDSWLNIGKVGIGTDSPSQKLHVSGGLLAVTNNSRTVTIGAQNSGAIHIYNDNNSPFFFNGSVSSSGNGSYDLGTTSYYWNVVYANRIIAKSTSDAAASLANPVALITGAPTGQHLEFDGNEIMSKASGTTNGVLYLNAEGGNVVICEGAGYVGVGVTSPSYKLHVSGDIYATGDVTADSDATLKTIMSNADLRVEQIANAPAVKFTWNDKRDDKVHTGTIAQYWQKILPECINDKSGTLSMNYGAAAMVSVINVAKEVVDHEDRIEELERENERLRQELRQLKSA